MKFNDMVRKQRSESVRKEREYALMACGHVSFCTEETPDGPKPHCFICGCSQVDRMVSGTYGLEGRKAKCAECRTIVDSNWGLAFFKYQPDKEYDEFYDGCWGWD